LLLRSAKKKQFLLELLFHNMLFIEHYLRFLA